MIGGFLICENVRISNVEICRVMEYNSGKGGDGMYKILIMDESEAFCRSLAELLPEEFESYLF